MTMDLKEQLESAREGFEDEGVWMRFLLESYTGSGGFQGRVRQPPSGFWGAAAATYSRYATYTLSVSGKSLAESSSYLDRFDREDIQKYQRRVAVAHYLNYVKPTTNTKVSYIVRKPHKRNNVPPKLAEWIERTGYDKEFRRRGLLAAVLGWFPMFVDMPKSPGGAQTAQQEGRLDPYVVLSLPHHLRDYQLDERGKFLWVKTAVSYTEKPTWNAPEVCVTRYTTWTPSEFEVYECRGEEQPKFVGRGSHPFGDVPIVSWRSDVSVKDQIKAESINADIALEARRLFNLLSELDEHIRSQVFALLIWPGKDPNGNEGGGEVGVKNGLLIDIDQKNVPFFLAPPASVAATLESRIEKSVIEIYRMALVEYEKASGVDSSAQSKEREFAKTNVAIVALATSLATADKETLTLVGRGLGIAEEELQKIECVAYESYADESLTDELEQSLTALAIKELGPTFRVEFLTRLAQKLLPGMGPDTRRAIEQEIAEAVEQAEKEREAALLKLEQDGGDDGGGGGDGGDGGDGEGDGSGSGGQQQPQAAE